jgi:hypothetical protein
MSYTKCAALPELTAAVYDRSPALEVLDNVFVATKQCQRPVSAGLSGL